MIASLVFNTLSLNKACLNVLHAHCMLAFDALHHVWGSHEFNNRDDFVLLSEALHCLQASQDFKQGLAAHLKLLAENCTAPITSFQSLADTLLMHTDPHS